MGVLIDLSVHPSIVNDIIFMLLPSVLIILLFNSHILFVDSLFLVSSQSVWSHVLSNQMFLLTATLYDRLCGLRPLLFDYHLHVVFVIGRVIRQHNNLLIAFTVDLSEASERLIRHHCAVFFIHN